MPGLLFLLYDLNSMC